MSERPKSASSGKRHGVAIAVLLVIAGMATWAGWHEYDRAQRVADSSARDPSTRQTGEVQFTEPAETGLYATPSDLLVIQKHGKDIIRIARDGRVTWSGDQSKAAVAFWEAVERIAPEYLDRLAQQRCP